MTSLTLTGRMQALVFLGELSEHLTWNRVYNEGSRANWWEWRSFQHHWPLYLKCPNWKETEVLGLQDFTDLDG